MRDAATALLGTVALLLFWQVAVDALAVSPILLPSPARVGAVFASDQALLVLNNTLPTAIQALSGFGAAALLGILLALGMGYSETFRLTLSPYLIAFQVIPKIALAPLFVLWLGIGFSSRFAFAVFMCFFPIVIALSTGLREAPPDAVRMCAAFGGSKAQIFRHIRFPFALGYLFAGLKIAATMSIIGVVVGEFITADRGLGYLILWASSRSDTPLVIAAILVLCVLGMGIYGAVALLDSHTRKKFAYA